MAVSAAAAFLDQFSAQHVVSCRPPECCQTACTSSATPLLVRPTFKQRATLAADRSAARSCFLGNCFRTRPVQTSARRLQRARSFMAGDMMSAATSAVETVLYPVANQPLLNLILPASSILSAFGAYYLESTGKNTGYSKFAKHTGKQQVPAKLGMLILYGPSFMLALYSLLTLGDAVDGRVTLVTALLAVHFGKRVAEVLFLHKFSGKQDVSTSVGIGSIYAFNTSCLLWVQNNVCANSSPPALDLSTLGVTVFTVGILGNLYHHWILAGLRKDENGGYQVPQGGLFGLVTCPHYFFEIVDFVGMALASQTFFAVGWCVFTAGYLTGRSVSTRNWYLKKVDNFPEERKNIVPFLF